MTGPGIVSGIQCFGTCSLNVSVVRKSNRLGNLVCLPGFSYFPFPNTLGLRKTPNKGFTWLIVVNITKFKGLFLGLMFKFWACVLLYW